MPAHRDPAQRDPAQRDPPQRDPPRLDPAQLARLHFHLRLSQALQRPTYAIWGVALWLTLVGGLVIGAELWDGGDLADRILLHGALMPDRVRDGQWWRLLTGPFLHQRWPHLTLNLVGLLLVGRQVERGYGATGVLIVVIGTMLTGAVGTVVANHPVSIGASGAVFGLASALVALGLRLWTRMERPLRLGLVGLPLVLLVGLFILGLSDSQSAGGLDIAAHIGGAVGGFLLGLGLPVELRDVAGHALIAAHEPWSRRAHAVVSSLLCLLAVAAVGEVAIRLGSPPTVQAPAVQRLQGDGVSVMAPKGYGTGVWRAAATWGGGLRCEGGQVDPAWTLKTHRVVCFSLPLAGVLLLGRAEQLVTLDKADRSAMARAWRERRFVWRQPQVLLAPAGSGLLYVVYGHPRMLAGYGAALARLLPDSTGRSLPEALRPKGSSAHQK